MTEREKEIATLYIKLYSQPKIAKTLGVSKQRIHQVIQKLIREGNLLDRGRFWATTYRNIPESIKIQQRFWNKVKITPTCWVWENYKDPNGYGKFTFDGRVNFAHRYSKSLLERLDPELQIDHLCRNPACVNPDHLEQVTGSVNCHRAPIHVVHGHFDRGGLKKKFDGLVA